MTMFWSTADDVIRKEIETVRARRMILDQLEGGPKTGSELRESIRVDMAAQKVKSSKRRKAKTGQVKVTDPKLYFNTQHLESMGIISSKKVSQQRVYTLNPKAIHPVRRIIDVKRPAAIITSMARPDDQRKFVVWICKEKQFRAKKVRILVEEARFSKGVSRNLAAFYPEGARLKWDVFWHDLPIAVVGDFEGSVRGDLEATYDEIERIILEDIQDFDLVIDISRGPPIITVALTLLAMEYSLTAVHAAQYEAERTNLTQVFPRE